MGNSLMMLNESNSLDNTYALKTNELVIENVRSTLALLYIYNIRFINILFY